MADIYSSSYSRPQQPYHRHTDPQQQQPYSHMAYSQQQQVTSSGHSTSSNVSSDDAQEPQTAKASDSQPPSQKAETKPQATFLTKLYALLERPENHHMIRWDPAGEHIIVERPEQLALHVLPSIYRQSRFASFSRQLNIYGFMRKVNLRNVDPAIDDPDASTWSHPTLNRHSPPEVVANFKRRVPPRLPKPRKREPQDSVSVSIPPPRSAIGMGAPLPVPSSMMHHKNGSGMRARGFSAPGSFTPLSQGGAAGWGTSYPGRSALPPLTVPSDPPMSHSNVYHQSHHNIHPITPTEDSPTSPAYASLPYSNPVTSSSQYTYPDQNNWQFSPNGSSSSHSGSLSSLLNPSSSGYSRPTPTINTSYASSPFSAMPLHHEHSSSLSPDSRPTTGYSMSSVSSLPYDDGHLTHDYGSRPNSSHHRTNSPSRPTSSKSSYHNSNSLRVGRDRRHSHAMSPYPNPYEHSDAHHRPSTSPQPNDDHHGAGGIARVRSMIQLPTVDPYSFNGGGQAEFAYSAVPGAVGPTAAIEAMDNNNGWNYPASRSGRPSTSTSSISAASHASSSQARTPDHYGGVGETDVNRFSPDFGFVQMNEHLAPQYTKPIGEI